MESALNLLTAALPWSFLLYALSLLVSMAGMEMFGWTSAVMALVVAIGRPLANSSKGKTTTKSSSENLVNASPTRWQRVFPLVLRPMDYALVALFLVIVLGVFLNTPGPVDYLEVIGSARWIVLFFGIRAAAFQTADENWIRRVIKVWTVVTIIVGIYAIVQYFFGVDLVRGDNADVQPIDDWWWGTGKIYRAVGFLGSPMTYGHSVVMVSCLLLGVGIVWSPFFSSAQARRLEDRGTDTFSTWRWWILFGALFGFIGLYCTYTRGAWLAAAIAVLCMGLLLSPRAFFGAIVGLTTALFLAVQINPSFGRRWHTIFDGKTQSFVDRISIWHANWQMFLDYPLLGIGYGENERLLSSYYEKMGLVGGQLGHAHNTFLQFLAGTGAVGFTLYAYFIVFIFVLCLREFRRTQKTLFLGLLLGLLGAQIALQVGGLTECNFKDAEVNHLYLFLAAMASSLTANRRAV